MQTPEPPNCDDSGVSEPVCAAAEQAGLGRHRASFGPVKAERIIWFVVFTAVFGVAAILLFIAGQWGGLLPGALAALFGYVGAQRIRVNNESRNASLELFDQGLIVADAGGVQAMRYDEAMVWQEIVHHSVNGRHNHSTHNYELQDIHGQALALHATTGRITAGFPHPEQWGPAIQQAVTDARYPAAWSAIAAGHRLEFGKFWITRSHLGARNKTWSWSEVNKIRTHNGLVQIKSGKRWGSLTDSEVSRIPNCLIFIALAERLCATGKAS